MTIQHGQNNQQQARKWPNKPPKRKQRRQGRRKKKEDITLEEAQKIALSKVPGTVENSETATEKGKPVYSFNIRNKKGKTTQVWVDEATGKVVHRSALKTRAGKG